VTLAAIAGESGLAPSTLVERFGSKRALLLAAGAVAMRGVATVFDAAEAHEPRPLAALSSALVRLSSGLSTRPALAHHLGVLRLDVADPDFRELAARHAGELRARVSSLLARALEEGELGLGTDIERLAQTLHVTYNGALVSWGIAGRGALGDMLRDELEAVLAPWRTRTCVR
jgi:AcrR family transcriptional regulator